MKKILFVVLCFLVLLPVCKKKEIFPDPGFVLQKWGQSIKALDYSVYKKCEKEPKSQGAFAEMYKRYYPTDIMVIKVDDLDKTRVKKDDNGSFYIRKVDFEFSETNRETRKAEQLVRGTMDFVKYIDGKRKNDGWLIWNRNLVRIKR